jgi:hypothetical protein
VLGEQASHDDFAVLLSVASKFEGVRIEKNEGRRERGSERGVDVLRLSEDVANDVSVTAQGVA